MKNDSSLKFFIILLAIGFCFVLLRDLVSGKSAKFESYKKDASRYYAAQENESSDYYRGFMDAVEMFRDDPDVLDGSLAYEKIREKGVDDGIDLCRDDPEYLEGSSAYEKIWHAGFEFGYEEGINGVEY